MEDRYDPAPDARRTAPAAQRNRGPILGVLERVLPPSARVLEVASGSGEHAVYFAGALPGVVWQPSDPSPDQRKSIAAWIVAERRANVEPPLSLNATRDETWPQGPYDAVFCANMVHIAPWEACLGLLRGAGRVLREGGPLCLYGPYRRGGRHTAESNAAFDESLRARDPAWGVRDLDDVVATATLHGLALDEVVEMPANNLTVVLRRSARS